ncbi:MAG: NAD-dependent epimerase/dehydratase family protein [Flavobacteriaceae bacterium]|nr:NAD-dependent epimerase/dehydratase family protein [Flavobacteriaceae bacterium]MDG2315228.1 NAD-dependent epimerase/dehydratase family protein [Flavobacteriaceae bacterium]
MILVTGGTGLVGSHLLFDLLQKEDKVRVLHRSTSRLDRVKTVFGYFTDYVEVLFNKIEWIEGSLTDLDCLEKAFDQVTQVYHCAALISFDPSDLQVLTKSNVEGTANMVNFSLSHKVEKFCYVSSIATLSTPTEGTKVSENTPWNHTEEVSVYAFTKHAAEMEVFRGINEGLQATIVNPGLILGGGFWRSGSGLFFKMIHKGMKYFTDGKTAYVDVEDVVSIMVQLMEKNIFGERYIVIAENWFLKDFIHRVAGEFGVKAPQKKAGKWLLEIGWRVDWLSSKITGKKRKLTKNLAKTSVKIQNYSNKKIIEELDFTFKTIEDSIVSTCAKYPKP